MTCKVFTVLKVLFDHLVYISEFLNYHVTCFCELQSHRQWDQKFAVAECVCAIVYETGMSVSGVHEHQCFASFRSSLPGCCLGAEGLYLCMFDILVLDPQYFISHIKQYLHCHWGRDLPAERACVHVCYVRWCLNKKCLHLHTDSTNTLD